jgi:phosphoenolpyruvate carboxylase
LRYYSDTNIGSRPAKRSSGSKLSLKDLRAIPYVGSWAQLKQNVTGYYGVGTALKQMQEQGHWNELKKLYHESLFIRTLLGNCEMALQKCFFPLTAYLMNHPQYGDIWNMIHDEYLLTKQMVLQLSGHSELMEEYPVEQLSVQMRERIVLPLLTIQQYAITQARELQEKLVSSPLQPAYEKLTMRCSFGIINAARNSA